MTAYKITPATSVHTTATQDHAFDLDSAVGDSLTVDAGAFLVAEGFAAEGAFLANTGAWNVTVNGSIVSRQSYGVVLAAGNSAASTITVGADGEVGGFWSGIVALSAATIRNLGVVSGTRSNGTGIELRGTGPHTVINSGTINADNVVFGFGVSNNVITNSGTMNGRVSAGDGNDRITNTGVINGVFGGVGLGDGDNSLVNARTIRGYVGGGDGIDRVTNSGLIDGFMDLGGGTDVFTNFRTVNGVVKNGVVTQTIYLGDGNDFLNGGGNVEIVIDGNGADTVNLGGGKDVYLAHGQDGTDGTDKIYGGGGVDTYDASDADNGVTINLDTVIHDLSPFSPGAHRIAANAAKGTDVAGAGADRIFEIENAKGGTAGDVIYGSAAINVLEGNGGTDFLFGFAGNDTLNGGESFDTLVGGVGKDLLIGGLGADSFAFVSTGDSGISSATRDLVADFEDGWDVVALDRIDAIKGTAQDDAFTFIGNNALFGGNAGELRAYFTATGHMIEGDVNGDKIADFSIALQDAAHSVVLTSSDFIL